MSEQGQGQLRALILTEALGPTQLLWALPVASMVATARMDGLPALPKAQRPQNQAQGSPFPVGTQAAPLPVFWHLQSVSQEPQDSKALGWSLCPTCGQGGGYPISPFVSLVFISVPASWMPRPALPISAASLLHSTAPPSSPSSRSRPEPPPAPSLSMFPPGLAPLVLATSDTMKPTAPPPPAGCLLRTPQPSGPRRGSLQEAAPMHSAQASRQPQGVRCDHTGAGTTLAYMPWVLPSWSPQTKRDRPGPTSRLPSP